MNDTSHFELARIEKEVKEIEINWSKIAQKYNLNSRTLKQIINAWHNHAVVDNLGYIWLEIEGANCVLRIVKRKKTRYVIDNFVSEYDKRVINGKTYIRGTALGKMIDENVQGARTSKKRKYSKFSRDLYQVIVDHEVCENIRHYAHEVKTSELRKMKSKRVNFLVGSEYEGKDELTLKPLASHAHFSHIRSASLFPELALAVWNGLLVNQDTHDIITRKNIQDEKQLYGLCKEKKWSIKWTKPFTLGLAKRGFKALIY
jgi:hypothetical protein